MRSADAEDGFATVVALGLMAVLLTLTFVVGAIGAIAVTRHRAEAAADLGALSAATHALEGSDAACSVARKIVEKHGAALTGCRLDGVDVHVEVTLRPPGRIGEFGVTRARARAGLRP